MPNLSNVELWNALRNQNANFRSHTSEGTSALFTERGFAQLQQIDPKAISDFFGLSVRAALQQVNISHAKDPLAASGVGETYDQAFGGIIQRMATASVKPTSPRFKGLKNGDSVDRWTVRKPQTMERFWKQNFDYQSFITLQEYDMKQIFISDFGMSEYLAGIMAGLENCYTVQRYLNKLEAISAGLSDQTLKKSQIIEMDITDFTDETQMKNFLFGVHSVIAAMGASAQTKGYNSLGFADVQDKSRLKLLVRAGYSAALKIYTLAGTFNPADLDLGIDVVEVENFGGVYAVKSSDHQTKVYPAYDAKTGEMIGYNDEENQTTAQYTEDSADIEIVDPHADVHAILMDKGWLFETIQNAYRVIPTGLNEAGLYENFWASAPNNSINYDRLYNFVVFRNPAE